MTVFRYSAMSIVTLLLAAVASARAEEVPPYEVSAEAVKTGEQLAVSIKLTKPLAGGGTETLAAPRLIIELGRRATVAVSTAAAAIPRSGVGIAAAPPLPSPERTTTRPSGPAAPASLEELESGIRIDLISIKGKDKAILVSTVMEKGVTTWAEAKTIDVTIAPQASKQ